jgi:hypothetical protein
MNDQPTNLIPSPAKKPHGRPKGLPKTGGRRAGTPNRVSRVLKDDILAAANAAGGGGADGVRKYLQGQAKANPGAFMSLLGKVLPMTVDATGVGAQAIVLIKTGVPRIDDDEPETIEG